MLHVLRLPRWNEVLLEIYRSPEGTRYCEKLTRQVKGSRTHLREIVKMLERQELIRVEPATKVKRLVLTEQGRRMAMNLLEVRAALGPPRRELNQDF